MRTDFTFPSPSVIDVSPDWPTTGEDVRTFHCYHPVGTPIREFQDIRFYTDDNQQWLGRFEKCATEGFEDAAFTAPKPNEACIIAMGAVFWVNVRDRTATALKYLPITSAVAAERYQTIVMSTWRSIYAHSYENPKWCLNDITDDRLRIVSIELDCIIATGFDGGSVTYKVDLLSGEVLETSHAE